MEIFFWILIAGLALHEIIALMNRSVGDTISEIVWRLACGRPIVPFLFGLVMGHFFW